VLSVQNGSTRQEGKENPTKLDHPKQQYSGLKLKSEEAEILKTLQY
jgi:hypothetical protein